MDSYSVGFVDDVGLHRDWIHLLDNDDVSEKD